MTRNRLISLLNLELSLDEIEKFISGRPQHEPFADRVRNLRRR